MRSSVRFFFFFSSAWLCAAVDAASIIGHLQALGPEEVGMEVQSRRRRRRRGGGDVKNGQKNRLGHHTKN